MKDYTAWGLILLILFAVVSAITYSSTTEMMSEVMLKKRIEVEQYKVKPNYKVSKTENPKSYVQP